MRICCCCGRDTPDKYQNQSVIVVNDDGPVVNQPTNKSANSSFRFSPSASSQSNGFTNDAVEFDEVDLGERETSLRLKDKSDHTCVDQIATNADTIQVTGLMLDQLYEDDAKQGNIDHSAEVIEDYNFDADVITEATESEVQQASAKSRDDASTRRLTIDLADDSFSSDNGLTSEVVIVDPTPAPRTSSSLVIPESYPSENCNDEKEEQIHQTEKSAFELGINELETQLPSTSTEDDEFNQEPSFSSANNNQGMYGGFSSSSDSEEENQLDAEPHQSQISENYCVLQNDETDKSATG